MLNKISKIIILVITLFLFINVNAREYVKFTETNDNSYSNNDETVVLNEDEKEEVNITENTNTGSYKIVMEDDAKLLSEDEKNKLMDDMSSLTEFGHVIFKSIDDSPYSNAVDYSENYYAQHFPGQNGLILLIDMKNREVSISAEGELSKILTPSKLDIITDNIYRYLSNQDYYDGAKEAYFEVGQLLRGNKIAEPMRYASNAVISLVVAFLINFIVIMITCSAKKSKQSEVVKGLEMAVAINSFEALSNGTHKVYSPISSDSGGSSSGGFHSGGHSGGGFSGGGGGGGFHGSSGSHRF